MYVNLPGYLTAIQRAQLALLVCLDRQRSTGLLAECIPHSGSIASADLFDEHKVTDSPVGYRCIAAQRLKPGKTKNAYRLLLKGA